MPLRGQLDERFIDVCMQGSSSTWCLLCALLGLKFLRATYHRLCSHGSRAADTLDKQKIPVITVNIRLFYKIFYYNVSFTLWQLKLKT